MSRKFYPYPADYKNVTSLKRARRAGNVFVIVLCCIIAVLLGAGAFFALSDGGKGWENLVHYVARSCPACPAQNTQPQAALPDAGQKQPEKQPEKQSAPAADVEAHLAQPFDPTALTSIPDVVDAVYPGVIGVLNYQVKKPGAEPVLVGSGSGFVFTDNGYIITNQHVTEGAAKLTVSLHDGRTYDATLVGSDIFTDVAVLKIEADGLTALPVGDSSKLRVGEFVLAIGDPISADELSGSVTFGILSALSRRINIEGFVNEYLQTDAAVNPGNSGGPLINMRGEVIGVTSAKYTSAGVDESGQTISSEGIGFALPINNVVEMAHSLIENGSRVRPGIGVTIVSYSDPTGAADNTGVYIRDVTAGGPADEAGLKAGDRLLKIDGVEKTTTDEFVEIIRAKAVGESVVMTVERGEEILDITVVIGDMNQIHR
ncbi:MAG: trypsin-like peptidase domain-containing protein [Clostridia bacterium]|nr:trypsin-like peptidase domain-containing protein [Clostridia bacterium]